MRVFLQYLSPHYQRVLGCFTMKFLGTGADLFIPWILSHIIDVVVPSKDQRMVFIWGGLMILISVSSLILNVVSNRLASAVSRDATEAVRSDLFHKITSLSAKQLDTFTIPSLETRLTSDTYNMHRIMGMVQRMGVRAPIMLVGGLLVTITIEPRLAGVLAATLPFIALTVWQVSRRGLPLYTTVQKNTDRMTGIVRENITGIRIIKALSKTADEKQRFEEQNNQVANSEIHAATTMALTKPIINMLLNGGRTLVILVGAWCVYKGIAKTGALIAFMTYFTIILHSMMSITRIFVMYSRGNASALRIAEVLETPTDLDPIEMEWEGKVEFIGFEDVSFGYGGGEHNVKNLSFSIHKGGSLGIIGGTASGKSTLLSLLLRLYDPQQGRIFIEGNDIRQLTHQELYHYFGVVRQGDSIFGDTVYQNITFGREVSEENLQKAVKTAQAEEFILAMPNGYEEKISTGGGNLSGGQKQRLLIARALAMEPNILILDDSSSALDYKTDLLLRESVRENYPNTTMIVVAQRISSVHQMDKIVVLDKGELVGIGSHNNLLESCDTYRELYYSQRGEEDDFE